MIVGFEPVTPYVPKVDGGAGFTASISAPRHTSDYPRFAISPFGRPRATSHSWSKERRRPASTRSGSTSMSSRLDQPATTRKSSWIRKNSDLRSCEFSYFKAASNWAT